MPGELVDHLLVRIVGMAQVRACELAQLLVVPRAGDHFDDNAAGAQHAAELAVVYGGEHVEDAVDRRVA